MKPRASYSLLRPALLFAALVAVTFWPYLIGDRTYLPSDMHDTMMAPFEASHHGGVAQNHYFNDGITQTYPYKLQTQEALRRGTLAYWNPYILGGYPEYAETLADNFDPFNVILLWMPVKLAIPWQIALQMLLTGIGMLLLLRRLGISLAVNVLFSGAFMLNSLFIATAACRWATATFCWVPFLTIALLDLLERRRLLDLGNASLALALSFLGGNFQSSFYVSILVALILLFGPSAQPFSVFSRLGWTLAVGLSAFLLSAPMWFPSLELFYLTMAKGGMLNSSVVYHKYTIVQRLLTLPLTLAHYVAPTLAGGPQNYSLKRIANVDITDFNGALGFFPSVMGLWAAVRLRRDPFARPFLLMILLALVIPTVTPLYKVLYHRFFIVGSFSLVVLGARALDQALRESDLRVLGRLSRYATIGAAALASGALAVSAAIALMGKTIEAKANAVIIPHLQESTFGAGHLQWSMGRVGKTLAYYSFHGYGHWFGILTALAAALLLRAMVRGRVTSARAISGLAALTFAQLIGFAQVWLPTVDTAIYPLYPPHPIMEALKKDALETRYVTWRDTTTDPYIIDENSSNVYRISDIYGYESLTPPCMGLYGMQCDHNDTVNLRMLGLAGVRYAVTRTHHLDTSVARPLLSLDKLTLYENRFAHPRAYLAHATRATASEAAMKTELRTAGHWADTAIVLATDHLATPIGSPDAQDTARMVFDESEQVRVAAHSRDGALLVLTDTYYPGWVAEVNGHPAPIYRVNGFLRGVVIPKGDVQVDFRFEPITYRAGVWASGTMLLVLLLVGLIEASRRKRRVA